MTSTSLNQPSLLVIAEDRHVDPLELPAGLTQHFQIQWLTLDPGYTRQQTVSQSNQPLRDWIASKPKLEEEFILYIPSGYGVSAARALDINSVTAAKGKRGLVACLDELGMTLYRPLLADRQSLSLLLDSSPAGNSTEAVEILGLTLYSTRESEAARHTYLKTFLTAEHATAMQLAFAFEGAGDLANALPHYRAVVEDNTATKEDRWLATYQVARIFERKNLPGEALNWAKLVIELWPERNEGLVLMARLLRMSGEHSRSLALLKLAENQSVDRTAAPYVAGDYGANIYAERLRTQFELGLFFDVLATAREYCQHALGRGADQEILSLRDQAYKKWRAIRSAGLPSVDARRNSFLIVVAYRNAGQYLQRCVDSIKSQTYRDYLLMLIDDASDDGATQALDLTGLPKVEIVKNKARQGALANQVRVLSEHAQGQSIAVFVDGDDSLAHAKVLEQLDQIYRESHCWVTYGQFYMGETQNIGFAQPLLPDEDIEDLFTQSPLMFPIHLRTHRVGLFHALLEQDPELASLKNSRGEYFAFASDIAHMRAMFMLSGLRRCYYVPDVMYRYNTANPESHFNKSSANLSADAAEISILPPLHEVKNFCSPRMSYGIKNKSARATDLMLVFMEGGDSDVIDKLIAKNKLSGIERHFPYKYSLDLPSGVANDVFWRGVFSGKPYGAYAASYRAVLDHDGYELQSFIDTPALKNIPGFWQELAMNGHRVAVLNPSDVVVESNVAGLTCISSWMVHAPLGGPTSHPSELIEVLHKNFPFTQLQESLDDSKITQQSGLSSICKRVQQRDACKHTAYLRLLEQGNWNLFSVGIDASHDALHKLWHFHDQQSPLFEPVDNSPVEQIYESMDQNLGLMLEAAGDAPMAMVVGLGGRSNSSISSMFPELLLNIEKHMRANQGVSPIPARWFRTVAAAPRCGAVRLNIVGRDPQGTVEPNQVEAVIDSLSEILHSFTTQRDKKSIVSRVIKVAEFSQGDCAHRAADLLVEWGTFDNSKKIVSELIPDLGFRFAPSNQLDYRTGDHSDSAAIYVNKAFKCFIDERAQLNYTDLAAIFTSMVNNPRPAEH